MVEYVKLLLISSHFKICCGDYFYYILIRKTLEPKESVLSFSNVFYKLVQCKCYV